MKANLSTSDKPKPIKTSIEGTAWTPHCLKLDQWPELDRQLLEKAFGQADLLDEARTADRLCLDSRQKIVKGYGMWLSYGAHRGWLGRPQHPAERLTKRWLFCYFNDLLRSGCRPYTILGRFQDLTRTLQIMMPQQSFAWIMRPNGRSLKQLLRPEPRPMIVPDAAVLLMWALRLMDTAKLDTERKAGLIQYRDGLLLAIFATRGRRLRSMCQLCIDRELLWTGDYYRVELDAKQVKTRKKDVFDLPIALIPHIKRYLEVVRPALLGAEAHDAVWVGLNGPRLSSKGIQNMVLKRSKAEFGFAFGPHRFRHALSTAAASEFAGPSGARVLGISADVDRKHYNKASNIPTVQRYQEMVERMVVNRRRSEIPKKHDLIISNCK